MSVNITLPNPPSETSSPAQVAMYLEEMREHLLQILGHLYNLGTGINLDSENKLTIGTLDNLSDATVSHSDGNFITSDSGDWVHKTSAQAAALLTHSNIGGLTGDAHSDLIFDTPTASDRNVIQPSSSSVVPFTLKGATSQSANMIEIQNSSGTVLVQSNSSGQIKAAGFHANSNQIVGVSDATSGQAHAVPVTQLESTSSGKGASLIGIQDAAGNTSTTTVEAALAELYGATLTQEQVQDSLGAMFTGNTETRCAVSYDDSDGTIDVVVDDMTANTQLTQEQVEDYVGGMLDGDETFITVAYDDSDGNIDFTVPVKDEDAMGSDSATHLATQQSIKAYIDSKAPSLVWEHFISWHGNTAAFTSGGAIGGKNVSVHDSSDHDEAVVMYNFTTGEHRGMAWNWVVPGDLDVGEVVSAQIYFRVSGAVDRTSNSTVYWGIEANVVADNESTATGGTKFSDTGTLDLSAGSHASGDLAVLDMGTQFGASSLVVGDYVRGVVWRDGTHISDNFGSTCQHIGIRFIGTKATT